MAHKLVIIGVLVIFIAGLAFLGLEVKNLRTEVARLSTAPVSQMKPQRQARGPRFAQPDDWWSSRNNRWDPYAELTKIRRQMNRLFDESFSGGSWRSGIPVGNTYDLSTDIQGAKDKYVISMDIPGMEKKNIDVEVKNNTLLVSGERTNENEENDKNYYRQERSFGYFSQSLPLPDDADSSGISVDYNKGVLKIELPKLVKGETAQQESAKIKVN